MIILLLIAIGLLLGLVLGRWWALIAAAGVGIWIGLTTDVDEVPPWFLGMMYALIAAVGIGIGIAVRRRTQRPKEDKGKADGHLA
jgi:membrane protein implicated in regulation of membrane protease activity